MIPDNALALIGDRFVASPLFSQVLISKVQDGKIWKERRKEGLSNF